MSIVSAFAGRRRSRQMGMALLEDMSIAMAALSRRQSRSLRSHAVSSTLPRNGESRILLLVAAKMIKIDIAARLSAAAADLPLGGEITLMGRFHLFDRAMYAAKSRAIISAACRAGIFALLAGHDMRPVVVGNHRVRRYHFAIRYCALLRAASRHEAR